MAQPDGKRKSGGSGFAGGSLIALGIVGGAVIGTVYGQPSIGFLVGLTLGILACLAVWLLTRR